MTDARAVLERTYACFNARDIDGVLAVMHPDVIEAARGRFGRLHLRTTNLTAARLYERLGFRRTGEGRDRTHVLDLISR